MRSTRVAIVCAAAESNVPMVSSAASSATKRLGEPADELADFLPIVVLGNGGEKRDPRRPQATLVFVFFFRDRCGLGRAAADRKKCLPRSNPAA